MAEEIEEAWKQVTRVPGSFLGAHRDAARALALAVAREIFSEHHPGLCGIWAAAYNDMLIEDLEALGR